MVTHGSKDEPWHIYLATTVEDPMVKIPFHFPFTQVFPGPPPYVFDSVLLVSLGWYCGTCELVTSRGRPRTQTGEERRGEERRGESGVTNLARWYQFLYTQPALLWLVYVRYKQQTKHSNALIH